MYDLQHKFQRLNTLNSFLLVTNKNFHRKCFKNLTEYVPAPQYTFLEQIYVIVVSLLGENICFLV